jgi:hypothetical protein
VIEISSPVRVGSNAKVRIQTAPGVRCSLRYITPSGRESNAQGLGTTYADATGVCIWEWTIGPNTRPGTGTIEIAANGSRQTFSIVIIK